MCDKAVYAADPQVQFSIGKLHKSCAKCHDCTQSNYLTEHDGFVVKDSNGHAVLLCKVHNKQRLLNKGAKAPAATAPSNIFTPEMEAMLAESKAAAESSKETANAVSKTVTAPKSDKEVDAANKRLNINAELGELVNNLANGGSSTTDVKSKFVSLAHIAERIQRNEGDKRLLMSKDMALLAALAKNIKDEGDESEMEGKGLSGLRIAALGLLWKLAIEDKYRLEIVNPRNNLVEALCSVLATDTRLESITRVLGVFHNVSLTAEAQKILGASEFGLLTSLTNLLMGHEDNDVKDRAAGVLWNLGVLVDNRENMVKTPSLLTTLVSFMQNTEQTEPDIQAKAIVIIHHLSLTESTCEDIAQTEGLLPAFVNLFKSESVSDEKKSKLCHIVTSLTAQGKNKDLLISPEIGLVTTLCELLATSTDKEDLQNRICASLWNLSVSPDAKTIMAEAGLVATIGSILKSGMELLSAAEGPEGQEKLEVMKKCCVILQNLAGAADCHAAIIDSNLDILATVNSIILNLSNDLKVKAFRILINLAWNNSGKVTASHQALTVDALESIVYVLQEKSMEEYWPRACGILQNLAIDGDLRTQLSQDCYNLFNILGGIVVSNNETTRDPALGTLLNLSVAKENKGRILAVDGLMDAVINVLKTASVPSKTKAVTLVYSLTGGTHDDREVMRARTDLIDTLTDCIDADGPVSTKALDALGFLKPDLAKTLGWVSK